MLENYAWKRSVNEGVPDQNCLWKVVKSVDGVKVPKSLSPVKTKRKWLFV